MCTSVSASFYRGRHKRTGRIIGRIIILALLVFCCLQFNVANAEPPFDEASEGPDIDQALDYFDFSHIDELMNDGETFQNFSTRELIKRLIDSGYSLNEVIKMIDLSGVFNRVLKRSIRLLITFMVLIVITFLIRSIGKKSDYNDFAEKVVLILCMVITIPIIKDCAQSATQVYTEVKRVSSVTVPILTTVLTAMGGIGTAGLTQALLILVNDTLLSIIQTILMPIIASMAIIYLISPLVKRKWLDGIADTADTAIKWSFGVIVTISSAIFSLRTMSMSAVDGVMLRTAEYAIDDLIPIVGGAISDITAVMAGGMLMVKNAVGIVTVILIVLKAAAPILLILMYMFIYKIAFSICKMMDAEYLAELTNNISKVLLLYLICCFSVMMMIMVIIVSSVAAANRIITYR